MYPLSFKESLVPFKPDGPEDTGWNCSPNRKCDLGCSVIFCQVEGGEVKVCHTF